MLSHQVALFRRDFSPSRNLARSPLRAGAEFGNVTVSFLGVVDLGKIMLTRHNTRPYGLSRFDLCVIIASVGLLAGAVARHWAQEKAPAANQTGVVEKSARLPIPSKEAQAKETKSLKEKLKADYAKTKPEDKLALAAKLLVPGREDRTNPAQWYVLLREARDLSIEAKRPRLAFEAIADMEKFFEEDGVALRVKAITEMSQGASDLQLAAIFRALENIVQQACDQDQFEAARRYLDAIENRVRAAKADQIIRRLRELRNELAEYENDFRAVTSARSVLQSNPEDSEANTTVGRYLCFVHGDWEKGLPLLAKGKDSGLKQLASKELAQPSELKDQFAIADGWWNRSETLPDQRRQLNLIRHAKFWYERAGAKAEGEDRQRVIDRLTAAQRKEWIRFHRLLPGSFFGREPEDRVLLMREGGGNLKSEEAIELGLQWLANHQAPNGSWSLDGFHRIAKCSCTEPGQKHDVAATAFGLLPFLGHGETHKRGKYAPVVQKAMTWLLQKQKFPDGNFSDNAYENALATTAIVELYGMTRDRNLRNPAQAAVLYIAAAQFSDGSWGYSKGTKGDLSVSGWQFTALKSAAYAGLHVPKETFDKLSQFLDYVASPDGLGYGYNAPGSGASTSAVGILCRQFLDWGPGHPGMTKALGHLLRSENFLSKERNNMYAVFYINQVAHHLGGERWDTWHSKVRDLLIELQDKGDDPKKSHQKGSWSPREDTYAKQGGRLMYTSLSLIALQMPYYHIPLYGYGPYTLLD